MATRKKICRCAINIRKDAGTQKKCKGNGDFFQQSHCQRLKGPTNITKSVRKGMEKWPCGWGAGGEGSRCHLPGGQLGRLSKNHRCANQTL